MTYREACRQALRDALQRDPRVFLMGEDVGRYGGCFAVSMGLLDEFGPERIRDTPLSESAFVGAGIGAALGGMRPIVEIMTVNFSLLALDQILNNAATLLHMSGGQCNVPLVIRMTTGGGRQVARAALAQPRGLVRAHSRPAHPHARDGRGRARHAVARARRPRSGADLRARVALQHVGGARRRRRPGRHHARGDAPAGNDVTLHRVRRHAARRARGRRRRSRAHGIDAEVIDLRTLRPLDDETIIDSVRRTHRAVIVDEGWRSGSISAEIAARIMEHAFYDLDAPVDACVQRRGADAVRASTSRTRRCRPSTAVVAAAQRVCGRG